jgi:hypothetical protein
MVANLELREEAVIVNWKKPFDIVVKRVSDKQKCPSQDGTDTLGWAHSDDWKTFTLLISNIHNELIRKVNFDLNERI